MFIPMSILIPMALLAFIPLAITAALIQSELSRHGLRLIGLSSQYRENNLLLERWCILYVPVRTWHRCHSYSTI